MKHSLPSILAAGFIGLASAFGVAQSAIADDTESSTDLPLEELRVFAEVFGRIKQDYVEPVDDRCQLTVKSSDGRGHVVRVDLVVGHHVQGRGVARNAVLVRHVQFRPRVKQQ